MEAGVTVKGRRGARCRCDCGAERDIAVQNLVNGLTKSCGCYKRDHPGALTHGTGYESYQYRAWQTVIGKCYRPSHKDYEYYGGRGIAMAEGWRDDFTAFADYLDEVLGPRPQGTTLDRIDNNGHYEAGNLRWATRSQQALNRRNRWRRSEGGLKEHQLFPIWVSIMGKCTGRRDPRYKDYGRRGITICDRWLNAADFIEDIVGWLGPPPDGMTLRRINNNGHYEPGNVRWAAAAEDGAGAEPAS